MTAALRLDDLDDLATIEAALAQLSDQVTRVGGYVTDWVCQRGAVEATDACVLRPLGPVFDDVSDALATFARNFQDHWRLLGDDLVTVHASLVAADQAAAARLDGLVR